ncbi:MAG: Zn-ribbon domain-containing OB-fold protein [Anaerolineaceae bacterium]|nr:Zn-ribbon domain-containing OB-fold protein [Anaerolineaceae bacterium]
MSDNNFMINGYFENINNKKLIGAKCSNCGKIHLPPRVFCDECKSQSFEQIELTGEAELKAYSVVYVPTSKMVEAGYGRENPNCVGIVKMSEGPMLSAEILGLDISHPEMIKIGAPLKAKFLERGEKIVLAFEA